MFFIHKKCVRLSLPKPTLFTFTKCYFKSWNIVFFGSDQFSLMSLETLHKKMNQKVIKDIEVVSKNTSCIVYKYAVENNLKVQLWPPKLNGKYDLGVVVSFGKLIPKSIIDLFPLGIINVHASLLPRWRGAMPISHALKNGDKETGITIMRINSKIDTGDMVLKKSIPIGDNELLPSLHSKLKHLGANTLGEVIDELPHNLEKCVPQPNENVTYAKILKKDIRKVNWNELTAEEVYNLYRSIFGLYTLLTSWRGINILLVCMSLNNTEEELDKGTPPGFFTFSKKNKCLIVQCKENSIKLCSVQVKKKLYTASKFYGGFVAYLPASFRTFDS